MELRNMKSDQEKAAQWFADLTPTEQNILNAQYGADADVLIMWRKETNQSSTSLTDTLLDNPMQEEEDYKDFIDAAYPSNVETNQSPSDLKEEEGNGRTIEQVQNMWDCDKAALAELGRKLTETEKLKDDLNYFLLKWVRKYEKDYPTLAKSNTDTLYIDTVKVLNKSKP